MDVLVLATKNKGKVAELASMLSGFDVEVRSLADYPEAPDIPETGVTFEENAMIKAEAVCALLGVIALADDSGLEVDALGGRPGVYSARYAGEGASDAANNAKLLGELADVPEQDRGARFVSVIAVAAPGGQRLTTRGAWEGRVAFEPRGEGGFGYDPLFFDPELGRTAAELSRDQKNARSHRGKALAELLRVWPGFWAELRGKASQG